MSNEVTIKEIANLLSMDKFIEVTLHDEGNKCLLLRDMVKELEHREGGSTIATLEGRIIYVKETYEQVKEMLLGKPNLDDLKTKPRHENGG